MSLPDPSVDLGFPARKLAASEGILVPDRVVTAWPTAESRPAVDAAIAELDPGVTEIHVQPAIDTPEVRAVSADADGWIADLELITGDDIPDRIASRGATCVGMTKSPSAPTMWCSGTRTSS